MLEQSTINKLKGVIPETVLLQIPDTAAKFNINTPLRLAHFLAQCAHESGNFTVTKENLNYSEERLVQIFKHDFDTNKDRIISESEKAKAKAIAHNPEKIANFVYANQNGNGNEASGEGYKYSGRGYIQLTGKINYSAFDKLVSEDILSTPALVATKYPMMSAAFFFNNINLWNVCDKGADYKTIEAVSRRVNGGTNGLAERVAYFNKFYKKLST